MLLFTLSVVGLLSLAPGSGAARAPLAQVAAPGSYRIATGKNPDGSNYAGGVELSQAGSVYQLRWDIGRVASQRGVGLKRGNLLGAAWATSPSGGVVIYHVKKGQLKGRWANFGGASEGQEELQGPAGLQGSYRITRGVNPGGAKYAGRVQIDQKGDVYHLSWALDSGDSISGVGILRGDTLVAGWGPGSGVVVYESRANQLVGTWAPPGGTSLGREVLAKRAKVTAAKPTPEAAPGVAGRYQISRGENPGGAGSYAGSVEWKPRGKAYLVDWSIGGGGYTGVALSTPGADWVAAGWGGTGGSGVVLYEVDGGRLRGRWATENEPGVGLEELSGPAGLSGQYKITKALNQRGVAYTGSVVIRRAGDTYELSWALPSESYTGVGILRGKYLMVGWGSGTGVVTYERKPGAQSKQLTGVWAQAGGQALGAEVLVRK